MTVSAVLDRTLTPPENSAAAVRRRVNDWIRRLNLLYNQLDEWRQDVPGTRVLHGELQQTIEYMMMEMKVPARNVPTYTILKGKERIAFVPSVIWIVGANGRVNITTNTRQYTLVDMGGWDNASSDWQLMVSNSRKPLIQFTKQVFLRLFEDGK